MYRNPAGLELLQHYGISVRQHPVLFKPTRTESV
jgi:hypothetical protein